MSTAEEKAAAQAAREKIQVTKNNPTVEKAEGEEENNEGEEGEEKEEKEGGEVEAEGEEGNDDNEEEGEETEGEEGKEVKTADQKAVEKLEKTISRLQKRIDKKSGSEKTLQKQIDALQVQLEAKQAEGEAVLTETDVQTRAERLAADKVAEREFTRACNKLASDANKIDKDFDTKVKDMGEEIGPIPSAMIGILEDLDNGGAVLAHLVNNVEDMEEIYALPLPKMSLRLAKISEKLAAKPRKAISNVPAPNEPVTSGKVTVPFDPKNTKVPMDEWVAKRNAQAEEHRKKKLGIG